MHEGLTLLALGRLCKFEIPKPRSTSILPMSVCREEKIPETSVLMGTAELDLAMCRTACGVIGWWYLLLLNQLASKM